MAHTIVRNGSLGKRRVYQVPPIPHAKKVGTFVGEVKSRRPEGLSNLPFAEILGGAKGGASTSSGRAGFQACSKKHPIFSCFLVPKDERVSPIVGLVSFGRSREGVLGNLSPLQ